MENMYLNTIINIFEPMINLYIITRCIEKEYRKSRGFFIIIYIIDVCILFMKIPSSLGGGYVTKHFLLLIMSFGLFYKNKLEIFISASMINIMWHIMHIFMCAIDEKINNILLLIIFQLITDFIIVKYTYRIVQFYKFVKLGKYSPLYLIIAKVICDILLKAYEKSQVEDSMLFIGMILMGYLMFFTIGVIYFINTKNKSNTIIRLTKDLDVKNCELKKIKDEHENIIYYLHYLVSSGRAEEAGENMENIINSDGQKLRDKVKFTSYKNDIISMVLKSCIKDGIKVIVREDCELAGVVMPQMELYRIMVNIVNNAVRAMNGSGILVIKVYDEIDEAVVIIENNGPKINDSVMENIFKPGFTTKNNVDKSHGFGLSIVKDIIESYNGTISVRSDDNSTEFEISLPLNKEKIMSF